ncbi:hypothetical protein N7510_001793 [Penicillium lagena]|uniref:uncharacterized protein n=1 Tax=Penicillium lagena TaxID=94218 RepID=UPI00253FBB71|nr:uncharacterized protein N7510_001793 [Penicillium lagena]KAJ5625484.1 hypothetical protein N7510_001793 [Penicillium lagena]
MASSAANDYRPHPLASPSPAYNPSSPLSQQPDTPRTVPPPPNVSISRKPLTPQTVTSTVHHSPLSPLQIDNGGDLPQPKNAQIKNAQDDDGPETPQLQLPGFAAMSLEDSVPPQQQTWNASYPRRKDSKRPPVYLQSEQLLDQTPSGSEDGHGNAQKASSFVEREAQSGSHNSSSRGSLESLAQTSDSYEPLHYHHQQDQNSKTGLRSVSAMNPADNRSGSTGNLVAPRSRIARPLSAYSSVSDFGGHRRNLSASPYMHARSSSRNSTASPDNRSLSLLDLLNTSYPQPGPVAAQLDNSYLRTAVGNNASLLTNKQTFEMYLGNVKKTDEPSVQYEFAVFMVNSMREMPNVDLESGDTITRARLGREARSILQRLADRSYPFAQYYLGDGYASGLFSKGKEDYDRAFPLFVAASKHGHVEACYRVALCYEFGWGCRVEGGRAVQFYRQAASKNHPGAMLRMAKACLGGDMGLGKRYREGIKWLKRAAESSDAQYNSAPYELGLLHETGYGDDVFKDESYAAQLFTRSAELGHVEASYRLGDAYEHGKLNCPRDPALSIHFYTNAAQNGHLLAMMALCAWYLVGAEPVLDKDEMEAYEWAARAAGLGLAKAQYAIGYFTEMGIGCHRDPLEANVWYVKAADQGDERAKHRIAAIRAAADGGNPAFVARNGGRMKKDGKDSDKGVKKRFVIF